MNEENNKNLHNDPTDSITIKQSKKSFKGIIFMIGLIIIILALLGLNFFFNMPKVIMLRSINNSYKEVADWFKEIRGGKIATLAQNNVVQTSSDITFNLKLRSSEYSDFNNIATVVNNFKVKLTNTEDEKNNARLTNVGLYSDADLLLDIIQYAKNKSNYVYAKEIFDKYIKLTDSDFISYYDAQSTADISYLSNKVKDFVLAQLKDSDFSKKSDKLKVDNKKISVSKVTLTITSKRANEILIGVLEGLKKDSKSTKVISDFYGEDIMTETKDEVFKSSVKMIIKGIEYRELQNPGSVKIGNNIGIDTIEGFGANSDDYKDFSITSLNPITISISGSDDGDYAGLKVVNATYTSVNVISSVPAPKTKEEAVKQALSDYIKELKTDDDKSNKAVYFSVYVTGLTNELVRYEISQKDVDEKYSYTTYKNNDNKRARDITYMNDASNGMVLRFISSDKDTNTTIYDITDNKYEKIVDATIINTIKETVTNKQFDSSQQLVINLYGETKNPTITFTINNNTVTKLGVKLVNPSLDNSVDVNDLTEEDKALIEKNLSKIYEKILYKLTPQATY